MNKYVTSCNDCPCYDGETDECNLTGKNPGLLVMEGCVPSWCPLRSGPVTLYLTPPTVLDDAPAQGRKP